MLEGFLHGQLELVDRDPVLAFSADRFEREDGYGLGFGAIFEILLHHGFVWKIGEVLFLVEENLFINERKFYEI